MAQPAVVRAVRVRLLPAARRGGAHGRLEQLLACQHPGAGGVSGQRPAGGTPGDGGHALARRLGHALPRIEAPVRGDDHRGPGARRRRVLHHAGGGPRRPATPLAEASHSRDHWRVAAKHGADAVILRLSRSLHEELTLLVARTLSLGEETALVLVRIAGIILILLVGWITYRLVAVLIRRLLRRLESAAESPARVQRARTLGPLF